MSWTLQFLQRLVDAGASAHKLDVRGYNALHYASVGGHMGAFQQLQQVHLDSVTGHVFVCRDSPN